MNDWDNHNPPCTPEGKILPQSGVPHLDIAVAFQALECIWSRQAQKQNIRITTHIDPALPKSIAIDGLKIQHCLNNLVSNAVQHSGKGEIQIVAALYHNNAYNYLILSVQDNGSGMDEETLGKLFLRHVPASEEQTIGFVDTGLPMTLELVHELGGQIKVSSHIGQGSVFALVLPLQPSDLEGPQEQLENPVLQTDRSDPVNLLVVDDYNLNQLTIKTMLHEHCAKIYSATNGFEALEILQSCPVDIILMDIHMPLLDGIETTMKIRESRESWSDIHIIAMTADPQYQHAELCRKIGMNGAMAKPIRKPALLQLLADYATDYKMAV